MTMIYANYNFIIEPICFFFGEKLWFSLLFDEHVCDLRISHDLFSPRDTSTQGSSLYKFTFSASIERRDSRWISLPSVWRITKRTQLLVRICLMVFALLALSQILSNLKTRLPPYRHLSSVKHRSYCMTSTVLHPPGLLWHDRFNEKHIQFVFW